MDKIKTDIIDFSSEGRSSYLGFIIHIFIIVWTETNIAHIEQFTHTELWFFFYFFTVLPPLWKWWLLWKVFFYAKIAN